MLMVKIFADLKRSNILMGNNLNYMIFHGMNDLDTICANAILERTNTEVIP